MYDSLRIIVPGVKFFLRFHFICYYRTLLQKHKRALNGYFEKSFIKYKRNFCYKGNSEGVLKVCQRNDDLLCKSFVRVQNNLCGRLNLFRISVKSSNVGTKTFPNLKCFILIFLGKPLFCYIKVHDMLQVIDIQYHVPIIIVCSADSLYI